MVFRHFPRCWGLSSQVDAVSVIPLTTLIVTFSLFLKASLPGAVPITWSVPRALAQSARDRLRCPST